MPIIYRAGITVTAALTPSLPAISAAALTSTSARVTYSPSHAAGTAYVLIDQNPTVSDATVKSTGAAVSVVASGSQYRDVTGLSPATTYYAHVVYSLYGSDVSRHSSAFSTPASGGGSTVYRSGITVTGALSAIVSATPVRAGATVTITVGGA